MTKKEQKIIDDLRHELALEQAMRLTPEVPRDLPPPVCFGELSKGWDQIVWNGDVRIYKACSSTISNGEGWDATSSQRALSLYSTELLATQAARAIVATRAAALLATLDRKIAELEAAKT
mgnify:FL=1